MRKTVWVFILIICFSFGTVFFNSQEVYAENKKVYLGGMAAGFCMKTRGAYVAGLADVITQNGIKSPSKDAGILQGDVITFINGCEINDAEDIERALSLSGEEIQTDYIRCGNCYTTTIIPATDLNGEKKIGLFIREDINGIGTVSFIDGKEIATLGHPVLNENDEPLQILNGIIYACNMTSCVKGERGKPGELRGTILKGKQIATINSNTVYGVFGTILENFDLKNLMEIEIGEGKPGSAVIYSTIEGETPKPYDISIIKVDTLLSDTRNYVIKVIDKTLTELTGGIVQGMSGSPIVQNGKLVGAVTHVFINDPTRGFGISINNMLNK